MKAKKPMTLKHRITNLKKTIEDLKIMNADKVVIDFYKEQLDFCLKEDESERFKYLEWRNKQHENKNK